MKRDKNGQECPNPACGNTGGFPVPDGRGGWEECQCEFCWTVEDSVFNQRRKAATGEVVDK